jgi:anti-anti-sigma factor
MLWQNQETTIMALEISRRMESGTCLIDLGGRLVLGRGLSSLTTGTESYLSGRSASGLVVNLTNVADMDSAGLGELMHLYKMASSRSWKVALAGANPRIREILKITHLDRILIVFESEQEAIEYIGGKN